MYTIYVNIGNYYPNIFFQHKIRRRAASPLDYAERCGHAPLHGISGRQRAFPARGPFHDVRLPGPDEPVVSPAERLRFRDDDARHLVCNVIYFFGRRDFCFN